VLLIDDGAVAWAQGNAERFPEQQRQTMEMVFFQGLTLDDGLPNAAALTERGERV